MTLRPGQTVEVIALCDYLHRRATVIGPATDESGRVTVEFSDGSRENFNPHGLKKVS